MSTLKAFKQRAQQISESFASAVPEGFPERLFYKADEVQLVSFLHEFELAWPLTTNSIQITEKAYRTDICNTMYDMNCDVCGSLDKEGKERKASKFTAALVYLHNAEPDDERGNFRVVELRGGKGMANFIELKEAERSNYLLEMNGQPTVWKISKTGKGLTTTYATPTPVPVLATLGKDFDPTIPQDIKDMLTPPEGVTFEELVAVMCLAPYGNVRYDLIGVRTPDEIAKLIAAKPKKSNKPSAKLS